MNIERCRISVVLAASAALAAAGAGLCQPPASQPGGGWIVFASAVDGDAELFKCRPDGTERTQITSNEAFDASPACSPDGKRIAFVSERDGKPAIYIAGLDGGECTRIAECGDKHSRIAWSPDGTRIAFDVTSGRSLSIHVADVAATGSKALVADGMWPAWSPDGKTIAFNRGNMPHVYVMDADGRNVRALLKTETEVLPDLAPIWSSDGTSIFYTAVTGTEGEAMKYEIRSVAADGTGVKEIHPISESVAVAFAPGGGEILYSSEKAGDAGLRILSVADGAVRTLTDEVVGPWASWCK